MCEIFVGQDAQLLAPNVFLNQFIDHSHGIEYLSDLTVARVDWTLWSSQSGKSKTFARDHDLHEEAAKVRAEFVPGNYNSDRLKVILFEGLGTYEGFTRDYSNMAIVYLDIVWQMLHWAGSLSFRKLVAHELTHGFRILLRAVSRCESLGHYIAEEGLATWAESLVDKEHKPDPRSRRVGLCNEEFLRINWGCLPNRVPIGKHGSIDLADWLKSQDFYECAKSIFQRYIERSQIGLEVVVKMPMKQLSEELLANLGNHDDGN